MSKDPSFPKSYNISINDKKQSRRWFKKDVDDWVRSRKS